MQDLEGLYVMTLGRRDIHLYPLKETLTEALVACRERPRKKAKIPLTHGLVIVLYVEANGLIHVLLSRSAGQPPSDQEARTVLKHWPEPIPASIAWTARALGKFNCLSATWSTPPPTPQQLPLSDE